MLEKKILCELDKIKKIAESHYGDMCDIEFSIQKGKLYIQQIRIGKRTGTASVKIAVELFVQGIISGKTLLCRINPVELSEALQPLFDPKQENTVLLKGLAAARGIAVGTLAITPQKIMECKQANIPYIIARIDVSPEDILQLQDSVGIITVRGGMTSHAATFSRYMKKPSIVGVAADIDNIHGILRSGNVELIEGTMITLDGIRGKVLSGEAKIISKDWHQNRHCQILNNVIEILAFENELPTEYVGRIWRLRDIMLHSSPSQINGQMLGSLIRWPILKKAKTGYTSFDQPSKVELSRLNKIMTQWQLPWPLVEDVTYIWQDLRLTLFRLLAQHVGIGRHQYFYRPLFDPIETIFVDREYLLNAPDSSDRIQILGEEFFGLNNVLSDYIEFESIRIYAVLQCRQPGELWRIDFTNPSGEKLLMGSQELIALKLVVNDAEIPFSQLTKFYNYFRKKEYFWSWFKSNQTSRSELFDYIKNHDSMSVKNFEKESLCHEVGLIDITGNVTKVGYSYINQSDAQARKRNYSIKIGE